MFSRAVAIVAALLLVWAADRGRTGVAAAVRDRAAAARITWKDIAPFRDRLEARGITSASFPSYVDQIRRANDRRVREGDLDHLVFYLLQSTRFTPVPSIEPALSAKALVDSLDDRERESFLREGHAALSSIPVPVRTRVAALTRALDVPSQQGSAGSRSDPTLAEANPRLAYFRELVKATFPVRREREAGLLREYLRVMRFLYEKEFVAQRSERGPEAVAELYRSRGLSTDTAVEAGYLVWVGLGVLKSLEPDRRIRRVLIVGPGLDLAPRTALREAGRPESYQPWAVIDALLALELSHIDDLEVVAADINPRVVEHLRDSQSVPPSLSLMSEIRDSETVTLSADYRDYFAQLGRAIGEVETATISADVAKGHLHKTVRVRPPAARALRAERLDIVTERLEGATFDLIVATNILPYFDDVELMLAISNVAAMLAPGGRFLHNEARPLLGEVTAELGLPFEQSRQTIIATVQGARAPLFDSVWLHRKASK